MDNRKRKWWLESGKNLLLLLLSLSAVYLIGRSGVYQDFGDVFTTGGLSKLSGSADVSGGKSTSWSEEVRPVRLAVKNAEGCYGVQYDSTAVKGVYDGGLKKLLAVALKSAEESRAVSEEQWREAMNGENLWVYYDFLGTVSIRSFSSWLGIETTALNGNVRCVLLAESDKGEITLYYGDPQKSSCYACTLPNVHDSDFSRATAGISPNGAFFAFEKPEIYGDLTPYVMILPDAPTFPVYEAGNPLNNQSTADRESMMRLFSFNPEASSVYESADGQVIREGNDTLRILNSGTVTFHGSDPQQARFPVSDLSDQTLIAKSVEILEPVLAGRCGDAQVYCLGTEKQKNSSVLVTFSYLLNGTQVQLAQSGYAAQFLYQDGCLENFTICFRQYQELESQSVLMPERQAVAAMNAMGQEDKELLACYTDDGTGQVTAGWVAH